MEIQFLGTSAGMPTKQRNVSATAIRRANSKSWYLVDCGEATQHRLLHTSLSLHNLEGVFITHMHGDHCYGLPGLLATASMSGRKAPLTIVGPRQLRLFLEATMASTDMNPGFPIEYVRLEDMAGRLAVGEFDVEAVELSHRIPSWAFGFYETPAHRKLDIDRLEQHGVKPGPEWGQIQKGEDVVLADGRLIRSEDYLLKPSKPRKIIIAGDNDMPERLMESATSANVLVHEATYTQARADKVGNKPQHSSAKMIASFAERAAVPNLILTHISPRYQRPGTAAETLDELEGEARQFFSGSLFLANDFDRYQLSHSGELEKL
ncbi:ribonuclease Z [Marinobacter sp.]|uniref:ribonuclease Z n=1 Tax=Marinobacter sp. TaxID=50741 RepID=UPI00384FC0C1